MAQNVIVVRARGARGPAGSPGPAGTGITILGQYNTFSDLQTAHPTGSIGQGYLVQQNLYVWNPQGNNWINVGPVQGPTGAQGVQGATGATGPAGTSGTSGATGSQGVQGSTGSQGTAGYLGRDGVQGIQGLQGISGAYAAQGIQGSSGIQGATGAGAQGVQGLTGSQGLNGNQGIQGRSGIQGTTGTGVQGIQGIQGSNASFSVGLVSFTYEQMSNAEVWNITHNLGFRPNVMVIDYGQNDIECDIGYVDVNRIQLTFSDAVSGYAYLS